MNDVRILLSHNFSDGGMPVSGDHCYIDALIQDVVQSFPETQWFHRSRT